MSAQPKMAFGAALVLAVLASAVARSGEILSPPPADEVRSQALEWVAANKPADEKALERIGALWSDIEEVPAADLFDRVIETFALADAETQRFIAACRLVDAPLVPPEPAILSRGDIPSFYAAHMRLFYGRYLARRRMYDEALSHLEQIDPSQVVDPAGCLFWKAVCQHQLLMKDQALATLKAILNDTEDVSPSYSTMATLMQYEIEALEEKSLGEVARKMSDSGRRLELARAGEKVRKVQDEIVADLDELIKKMEQQSGGRGGSGEGSGRNRSNQSSNPANDSVVKGATAEGKVDEKNLRNEGGWGALPPKEQARAQNLLNQNFPSHYRQAVEEYLKKIALRRAGSGG